MSEKEINRLEVVKAIEEKRITQAQASKRMGVSTRQVKRICRNYREGGAGGLINKMRGKASHNQLKGNVMQRVLDLILERYRDFGPTLATEKLVEVHGIKISDESVRKIMIAEGIWKRRRKRKYRVFQMRERRAGFGELIQIDGSDYDWFEGRSPRCSLLVFIDDATGKLVELWFVPHESFFGYCEASRHYFERYGKPEAFYSDKHGIFRVNIPNAGKNDNLTQFGRAMQELDIQIICASTPQAKGRVERANQTLQDRLTKELRLLNISTLEEANAYLPGFIEEYNHRFVVEPRSSLDAHRPLSSTDDLDRILSRQETRSLSKNLTLQYHKVIYQIRVDRPTYAMRNAVVTISENTKGEVSILYKGKPLPYVIFHQQVRQAEVVPAKSIDFELCNQRKAHKPAPDHPWRRRFLYPKKVTI